ncbi:MAG: signal peptidase [Proteobacteria bacterium]|nr:signal peptidase [Pseudomonadota bacterium]
MRKWLMLAFSIVVLDQISKQVILASLGLGERLAVVSGLFDLTLAFNPGAAFSFLADAGGWQRHFFTLLAFVISGGIVWLLKKHADEPRFCLQLALILGGALGNAIDRVAYGHVVDFILVYYRNWYYPAFNLADSAICIGVALMLFDGLLHRDKKEHA